MPLDQSTRQWYKVPQGFEYFATGSPSGGFATNIQEAPENTLFDIGAIRGFEGLPTKVVKKGGTFIPVFPDAEAQFGPAQKIYGDVETLLKQQGIAPLQFAIGQQKTAGQAVQELETAKGPQPQSQVQEPAILKIAGLAETKQPELPKTQTTVPVQQAPVIPAWAKNLSETDLSNPAVINSLQQAGITPEQVRGSKQGQQAPTLPLGISPEDLLNPAVVNSLQAQGFNVNQLMQQVRPSGQLLQPLSPQQAKGLTPERQIAEAAQRQFVPSTTPSIQAPIQPKKPAVIESTPEIIQNEKDFADYLQNTFNVRPNISSKSPIESIQNIATEITKSLNLPNYDSQLEAITKERTSILDEKVVKLGQINDNPWISEADRVRQTSRINDIYQQRLDSKNLELQLLQSVAANARQQAQFITGQAINLYQNQVQEARLSQQDFVENSISILKAQQDLKRIDPNRYQEINGGLFDIEQGNYIVPPQAIQKPVTLGPEELLVDPLTGKVISRGLPKSFEPERPITLGPEEVLVDPRTGKIIGRGIKDATGEKATIEGVGTVNISAYALAQQYATSGVLPSPSALKEAGTSFGEVSQMAKEIPQGIGTVVSRTTGVKDSKIPAAESEDFGRLYNIVDLAQELKKIDIIRGKGLIATGLGAIFGAEDQAKYMTIRKAIVDEISRMQSGAALTKYEQKTYEDYLPTVSGKKGFVFGQESSKKIQNFIDTMDKNLTNRLNSKNLSIYGYSKVKLGGKEFTVGDIIESNGIRGRVLPDGSISVQEQSQTGKQSSLMRTDRHNNPTAMTTDVARSLGLKEGTDYVKGDPFTSNGNTYYTARLIGDPIETTIKGLDKGGFFTSTGQPRWMHTSIAPEQWRKLSYNQKVDVVKQMYQREGNQGLLNRYFG